MYAINAADGTLGKVVDKHSFGTELRTSHAHCGVFAPGNAHAFVCDLGLDGIHQFHFDESTGKLRENEVEPFCHSSAGSGPRHMAFHPNNVAAYTINEKDSTIDSFSYHAASGRLRREFTLSTLPDDFKGDSYCAEITVSPDGRHVYVSSSAITARSCRSCISKWCATDVAAGVEPCC